MPSPTVTGYGLLRSNIKSARPADVAEAVAYARRIKFYPLSQAANPPQTTFVDAIDKEFDSTIPYDLRFFESLDRFVQKEQWLTRDKAMIDTLKSIGIEKGKQFAPNAKTKEILEKAALEAHAFLDAKYEALFSPPYFEGTHWALPASLEVIEGMGNNFAKPDSYPVDGRGVTYSFIFFSTKHLGKGQSYLVTIKDKEGKPFDGGSSYHLRVPANAPVKLYWSAAAYDRATHALIKGMPASGLGSNTPALQKNADGSVDLYFGPKAPASKESNWVAHEGRREIRSGLPLLRTGEAVLR